MPAREGLSGEILVPFKRKQAEVFFKKKGVGGVGASHELEARLRGVFCWKSNRPLERVGFELNVYGGGLRPGVDVQFFIDSAAIGVDGVVADAQLV